MIKKLKEEFEKTGHKVYVAGRNVEGYSDIYVHWLENKLNQSDTVSSDTVSSDCDNCTENQMKSEYNNRKLYEIKQMIRHDLPGGHLKLPIIDAIDDLEKELKSSKFTNKML